MMNAKEAVWESGKDGLTSIIDMNVAFAVEAKLKDKNT